MLGKTHFFIGISTAFAVLQPQSVPVLVTGISAAAVGSVISDIDSGTSQAVYYTHLNLQSGKRSGYDAADHRISVG